MTKEEVFALALSNEQQNIAERHYSKLRKKKSPLESMVTEKEVKHFLNEEVNKYKKSQLDKTIEEAIKLGATYEQINMLICSYVFDLRESVEQKIKDEFAKALQKKLDKLK